MHVVLSESHALDARRVEEAIEDNRFTNVEARLLSLVLELLHRFR